jgi:hypothetical protein
MRTSTALLPVADDLPVGPPADPIAFPPATGPVVPLNVLVLYGDAAAGRRAMAVLHRLATLLDAPSVDLRPVLWRFDLLDEPHWREGALADSVAADLVIFASSGLGSLPEAVNSWAVRCAARPPGKLLTMVKLLGEAGAWKPWIFGGSRFPAQQPVAVPRAVLVPALEKALLSA